MEERGTVVKVSPHGFRNIKPMTREERRAMKDKGALEKERLMKRTGPEARMYRANAPTTPLGLLVPEPSAAGFLSDADRFHTDVSGEEYLARQAKLERKQHALAARRVERLQRDEERWTDFERQKEADETYWSQQRDRGDKARKNSSSVPYDAINLTYSMGIHGDELRHRDDHIKYRAALRSRNLQINGDTRAGYNIINGIEAPPLNVPPRPQPSDALASHIDAVDAAAAAHRAATYANMVARTARPS